MVKTLCIVYIKHRYSVFPTFKVQMSDFYTFCILRCSVYRKIQIYWFEIQIVYNEIHILPVYICITHNVRIITVCFNPCTLHILPELIKLYKFRVNIFSGKAFRLVFSSQHSRCMCKTRFGIISPLRFEHGKRHGITYIIGPFHKLHKHRVGRFQSQPVAIWRPWLPVVIMRLRTVFRNHKRFNLTKLYHTVLLNHIHCGLHVTAFSVHLFTIFTWKIV